MHDAERGGALFGEAPRFGKSDLRSIERDDLKALFGQKDPVATLSVAEATHAAARRKRRDLLGQEIVRRRAVEVFRRAVAQVPAAGRIPIGHGGTFMRLSAPAPSG